jgi:hypothetical protein
LVEVSLLDLSQLLLLDALELRGVLDDLHRLVSELVFFSSLGVFLAPLFLQYIFLKERNL